MVNQIYNVPYGYHEDDSKCPKCGRPEEKVTVCKHCGYEYSSDDVGCGGCIIFVIVCIISIWIIGTVIYWLSNNNTKSLLDVLIDQWNWIKELRIL